MDPFGWVGRTLAGKYRIESVVGEGGFAVVYQGHHLGFDEPIAVKCLKVPASLNATDRAAFLETFLAEGRLLHKLSKATAGIVQALDVGAAESPSGAWTPYIVLEWLDGITLHRALREREDKGKKRGRAIADAVALLDPAARALAVAHENGVAHRDVKPANLFLSDVGGRPTLKVLDFGIAKVISDSVAAKATLSTGHAMAAFTPRYAAPEQFSRAYGPTGPWTDVFAFALVLVEVVAGKVALDGDEAPQIYLRCCDLEHRPTLRALGVDDVPDALETVLQKALAVDPRRRYSSLGELWDAVVAAAPASSVARPSDRAGPIARLTTDLSIAVSRPGGPRAGRGESTRASGSFDIDAALDAHRSRAPKTAFALGIVASAGATAFVLYTSAADEQVARAAELAAAGLSPSPSPTELPPSVVSTIAFKVPAATPRPQLHISTCGKVQSFTMDATDVPTADFGACVASGTCPPVPQGGVLGGQHADAYCRHAGRRALTTDEAAVALRALDAATFGLRCARL